MLLAGIQVSAYMSSFKGHLKMHL